MPLRDSNREDLFRSIHDQYRGRVMKYFRRGFRASFEDAEDMTQDVFGRFHGMLDEYRGDAVWALLEKIALSVACNRLRALKTIKRGAVKPDSLDDEEHPDNHPKSQQQDPLERILDAERKASMRREIEVLPDGQRRCLQLWLEDLTYEEILQDLQISLDAVKSRIRDAKRELRKRLGDENALPEDES